MLYASASLSVRHKFIQFIQYIAVGITASVISLSAFSSTVAPVSTPSTVRVALIGSGSLGGTIGQLLVRAGYDVMFSSKHIESDQQLAKQLGSHAFAGTPEQAAHFGTVVILAVPYGAIPSLGKALDKALQGKVLLDGTNPYEGRDGAIAAEADKNGAGETTLKYFPGTRVVRVFNGVYASAIQSSATRQSDKLGIPIAGDDKDAVSLAAQLVSAIGAEPVIVGNLSSAKLFQPGGPGFGANTTAAQLRQILGLNK